MKLASYLFKKNKNKNIFTALQWFVFVKLANYFSSSALVTCGEPQGSILGPFLITLYKHLEGPLFFFKLNISKHCYTNDNQPYLPVVTTLPPWNHFRTGSKTLDDAKLPWNYGNIKLIYWAPTLPLGIEQLLKGPSHLISTHISFIFDPALCFD